MKSEDPFKTEELLNRSSGDDEIALGLVYGRYIRKVEAWARGRVPRRARGLHDTHSVAHDVLARALMTTREGHAGIQTSFAAYVRTALRHRLIDLGKGKTQWLQQELDPSIPADQTTELDRLVESEFEVRLVDAVAELKPEDRELLSLRFEQALSYADIATELGLDSPDAARMRVNRALARLRDSLGPSHENPESE